MTVSVLHDHVFRADHAHLDNRREYFLVAVRMRPKAGPWLNQIVINHSKHAKIKVVRVEVP